MNHKSFNKNEKQNKKGGHTNMRTRMKKLVGLASGLFLALGMLVMDSAPVHADYNVANDSAAMVIRIRLNIDRSVAIATGDVDMDLGYVPLNTSTFTLHPASVTIGGNINNTELSLAAMISGGWGRCAGRGWLLKPCQCRNSLSCSTTSPDHTFFMATR